MESVNLRDELDTAIYERFRFTSLSAIQLRSNTGKGRLLISVEIALKKAEGSDVKEGMHHLVSAVQMKLYGVPHDAAESENAISQAAFKIEADVQALIAWKEEPTQELQQSHECAAFLARPLFVLAGNEIRALAAKLGFNGLRFEMDLQRVLTEGNVTFELRAEEVAPKAKIASKAPRKSRAKK